MKVNKKYKVLLREKAMTELCKERGWDINQLTTGQMLFVINHPSIKSIN